MDFPAIKEQITTLAENWETECIQTGASIYAKTAGHDVRRWRLPPLTAKVKSKIVSLNTMLRDFYYQPSGDVEVIKAWDTAVEILMQRTRGYPTGAMNREFNKVFHDMVFGCDHHHPYNNMAQFLYCASLHNRELEVTTYKCILKVGKLRIGMDRTGLFTSTKCHRTRMTLSDYKLPLRCQRGGHGKQPVLPETNAAYRLLMRALPHRAHEIEIGFGVAVQMGLEMEKVILAHLDVVLDADTRDDSETDVLFEARRLIEVSINNPVRLLAQLLVPKYGAKAFTKRFGSPYQRAAMTYTSSAQIKHRTALEALENDTANKVEIKKASGKDQLLSHLFGV